MAEEYIRPGSATSETIAEMNLIETIRNILRDLTTPVREFNDAIIDFEEGRYEAVKVRYARVRNRKNEIEDNVIKSTEYMIRVGPGLLFKDIYANILSALNAAAERVEAFMYRLYLLTTFDKIRFGDEIVSNVQEMIKIVLQQIESADIMLTYVASNPKRAVNEYLKSVKLEDTLDDVYRAVSISVLKAFTTNVAVLMLVKEMIDKIEDLGDILKSIATQLHYIALHKV
ncbi:MAG TPA: hypothetical protein ENF75_05605 [Acidilobales archaeon]|nr:hypothetical protein [Acidilobales archaeon]